MSVETKLSKKDSCDRCEAQAYVETFMRGETSLKFCGHHYAKFEMALEPLILDLVDERHRLEPSV